MFKTTYKLFIKILLLLVAVFLFSMCSNGNRTVYNDDRTHRNYDVNHYIDTIRGHIILTTVCYNYNTGDVSVSTLKLKELNN